LEISEIGEFELINKFANTKKNSVPQGFLGIGDDCAVIPKDDNNSFLVTTDMLIEDIHFIRNRIDPVDLGFKSLAVNVSDIAGMGGIPVASFVSLSLPGDLSVEWVENFYRGYNELGALENVHLLGGDTTGSKMSIAISITVLGEISNDKIKYRSNARPGDLICVTDKLGDSSAGLKVVLDELEENELNQYLLSRHVRPYPHVKKGSMLSRFPGVTSMMDISDGIGSDFKHIANLSGVDGVFHLEKIPVTQPLIDFCKQYNYNLYDMAIYGGEDYSLLFTLSPCSYELIDKAYEEAFGEHIHVIGEVTEKQDKNRNRISFKTEKGVIDMSEGSFNHFRKRN
jgi:thiamine-monophosphate kinase